MPSVFVSGTSTGVGKTWVAAATLRALRSGGIEVHARKPVQSFDVTDARTDADVLAAATGEDTFVVCPSERRYALPLAPPMAAERLGAPAFTIDDLARETSIPPTGICFIEGVGGPRSPIASDGDSVELADTLGVDVVVLVSSPGLGAINDVLLGTGVYAGTPTIVFLNRLDGSDDVHGSNRDWLVGAGLHVSSTPEDLADRLVHRLGPELTDRGSK